MLSAGSSDRGLPLGVPRCGVGDLRGWRENGGGRTLGLTLAPVRGAQAALREKRAKDGFSSRAVVTGPRFARLLVCLHPERFLKLYGQIIRLPAVSHLEQGKNPDGGWDSSL